jgi:hypothetical protein
MASPNSTTTTVYGVGGGNPAQIGTTTTPSIGNTGQVGFYGVAAITQPTTSNEAAAISTAAVTISATQWAFATSTQANGIVTLVNQLRADLVALGLIKGS